MVKCNADQVRRLQRALKCEKNPKIRQRMQMVLLRESGMTQPEIADATGVALSTVNRAHMAYDHGGRAALAPKPSGGRIRENMTLAEGKGPTRSLCQSRRGWRDVEHPRFEGGV